MTRPAPKQCPLCASAGQTDYTDHERRMLACCSSDDCGLSGAWVPLEQWNTRPDPLRGALEGLLKKWGAEAERMKALSDNVEDDVSITFLKAHYDAAMIWGGEISKLLKENP